MWGALVILKVAGAGDRRPPNADACLSKEMVAEPSNCIRADPQ